MSPDVQVRRTALAFAGATLLATRVPGAGLAPWLAAALALATFAWPAYRTWGSKETDPGRAPVILLLLLMSVPPAPGALLGQVPPWAIALVTLPALHLYLTPKQSAGQTSPQATLPLGQLAAILAIALAILAGPGLLGEVLPARYRSLALLDSSFSPLLVAGALILAILTTHVVRERARLRTQRQDEADEADQADPSGAEGL